MASRVSLIVSRNPILWTTCTSCPDERDLVAVFPMQDLRATYAKVANKAANRSSGRHVSLRQVAAKICRNDPGRGEKSDVHKADDKSFVLFGQAVDEYGNQIEGTGEACTDQEVVKVTGSSADWVTIWDQACVCLAKTAFSYVDISDIGIGSQLAYPREAVQLLGQAMTRADLSSASGCQQLTIATDSTYEQDQPEVYVLSADSGTLESNVLLGPEDCKLIAQWLQLSTIRPRIRQVHMKRTLTGDAADRDSSIGVRGKFYLAQALASRSHECPSEVQELQVDIAHTTVTLRSDQQCLPGLKWTLKDLEGLTVGDVALLAGWIQHVNLKKIELYSTGVDNTKDDSDRPCNQPYTLGMYDPEDPEDYKIDCILRNKNLGPADIGLLAAWLNKPLNPLRTLDISQNSYIFDGDRSPSNLDFLACLSRQSETWEQLCSAIATSSLKNLNVASTRLEPQQAAYLFDHAEHLERLNVGNNSITFKLLSEQNIAAEVSTVAEPESEADIKHLHKQLTMAVHNNRLDDVQTLLKRGADVNKPDSNGITPLISAALNGFKPLLEQLCRAGALLNVACHVDGSTAFHACCRQGHVDVAVTLINAGCSVTALDKEGMTGEQRAEAAGHTELCTAVREARKAYVDKSKDLKRKEAEYGYRRKQEERLVEPHSVALAVTAATETSARPSNPREDLQALSALRALVSISQSIIEINLSNCGLTSYTLAELLTPINCWASNSLKSLLLSGNKLTADRGANNVVHGEGIAALIKVLCLEHTVLTELDVSNTGLAAAHLRSLGEALSGKATSLRELNISGNPDLSRPSLREHVMQQIAECKLIWSHQPIESKRRSDMAKRIHSNVAAAILAKKKSRMALMKQLRILGVPRDCAAKRARKYVDSCKQPPSVEHIEKMDKFAMESAGLYTMEELCRWSEQHAKDEEKRQHALLQVEQIAQSRARAAQLLKLPELEVAGRRRAAQDTEGTNRAIEIREEILKVYKKYNPGRLRMIDIDLAQRKGNEEQFLAEVLRIYANINYVDVPGWPEVVNAACFSDVPRLKSLIATKADVNEFSGKEPWRFGVVNPLLIASQKGHLEVVELLIQAKANLEISHSCEFARSATRTELCSDSVGQVGQVAKPMEYASPLVFAMEGQNRRGGGNNDKAADGVPLAEHARIVKSLVTAKAHLGTCLAGSESLRNAIHYAVLFNQPHYIHLLVNMGADIDALDQNGRSALWYATQTGRVEAAKQLVSRGATLLSASELQDAWNTEPDFDAEPEQEREPEPESIPETEPEAIATTPNSLHTLSPELSLLHAW